MTCSLTPGSTSSHIEHDICVSLVSREMDAVRSMLMNRRRKRFKCWINIS